MKIQFMLHRYMVKYTYSDGREVFGGPYHYKWNVREEIKDQKRRGLKFKAKILPCKCLVTFEDETN